MSAKGANNMKRRMRLVQAGWILFDSRLGRRNVAVYCDLCMNSWGCTDLCR